jgi:hypothetical protein
MVILFVEDQDMRGDGSPRTAGGDVRLGAPPSHPGQGAHLHHPQAGSLANPPNFRLYNSKRSGREHERPDQICRQIVATVDQKGPKWTEFCFKKIVSILCPFLPFFKAF